uniref:Carboxylic ester hydrolase n=2 Tax=Subpsaltria yangi TaxID=1195109 RepID=A0A2Z4HPR2_9HEMI|nr:carboxylesterase E8 [Subpsaltria yangi]
MKSYYILYIIIASTVLFKSSECAFESFDTAPIVHLSTGLVRGLKLTSAVNKSYFSFKGVPYAAPPLKHLRFTAPQPLQNWTGVWDAFDNPSACMQPLRDVGFPETYSENCLFVNVYTKVLNVTDDKQLMPVMVWFYGGEFFKGTASSYKYGPDFLLEADVVVVTVYYRLGVFGFLNMQTKSAQGNAGLKDQVAALRWVQKEIKNFGGDANRVTIFGGSSGGSCVNYLYLSPLAHGLFHRAVSQSGLALQTAPLKQSTYAAGKQLASYLRCPTASTDTIMECLKTAPADDLIKYQIAMTDTGKGEYTMVGKSAPFLPTVEKYKGEEVFLPKQPWELVRPKSSPKGVPYIIGVTSDEGLFYVYDDPDLFTNFEKDLKLYLPSHIQKTASQRQIKELTTKVKEFYFGNQSVSYETIQAYIDLHTDRLFLYPIILGVRALRHQADIYLFQFAYKGAFKIIRKHYVLHNLTGAAHGGELGYLFYRNHGMPAHNNLSAYPEDLHVLSNMVKLWTNFAKYGKPTPVYDDQLKVKWKPVESNKTNFLKIDIDLQMVDNDLNGDRIAFWDSLYSLVLSENTSSENSAMKNTGAFPYSLIATGAVFLAVCIIIIMRYKRRKQNIYLHLYIVFF